MAPLKNALGFIGSKISEKFGSSKMLSGIKSGLSKISDRFKNSGTAVNTGGSSVRTAIANEVSGKVAHAGGSIRDAIANEVSGKVATTGSAIKDAVIKETGKSVVEATSHESSSAIKSLLTAASIGVSAYQVHSANAQYKDSVKRTNAYNASVKAEAKRENMAKQKAAEDYNSRLEAYNLSLSSASTSANNMLAGDGIFSSTVKNYKYTLI